LIPLPTPMHDRRGIGRLFMAGLPGTGLDPSSRSLIEELGIANFILFTRNVASPEQLRTLCHDLHACCLDQGFPCTIAIDQEGGRVTRLPPPFTQFPDPRAIAMGDTPEETLTQNATVCARELKETGITMNLAPVVDVSPAGHGYYMEQRSLGGDPDTVSQLATLYIKTMQQWGITACAKHFPGLGSALLDPHRELFRVESPEETIRRMDLPPFLAAINAGVAAVMISHTIHPALDPDTPATLSEKILTDLLRGELGFTGTVLTDDMEMGAMANHLDIETAAVRALAAGADLVLICHDHDKVRRACRAVARALDQGTLGEKVLSG